MSMNILNIRVFVLVAALLLGVSSVCVLMSCNTVRGAGSSGNPVSVAPGNSRHQGNPYPVIPQKAFIRSWTGTKKCNQGQDETPSEVAITSKDSTSLYVSGFLNAGQVVEGKTRGYVILVHSPQLEGSFSLSNDWQILRAFLITQVDGHSDSCSAVYYPAK